jgi:phage shock protein A
MSAPVRHTCPDIDKVIAAIKSAVKTAENGRKQLGKDSDAEDYLYKIIYDIEDLPHILEDLRNSNSSLRDWGHDLEKTVDELEGKVCDFEKKIEELESELENAKQQTE